MGRRKTFRSQLQAQAVEHHGYVTKGDARRLGVPPGEFDRLVARGKFTSVCADLYRLDGMPPGRRDTFSEAVLRVGPGAFLSHDAVLALHGLTENEPDRVRVATARHRPYRHGTTGTRLRSAQQLEVLHRDVPAEDLTSYRGIRSTTVARALLDCHGLLAAEQLISAAEQAVRRGLLLRRERNAVLEALELSGV
jgi:predicted transcriptional regulator of viral defense system